MAKQSAADASKLSEGGGIEMSSMMDVTFLLIIFFMCTTEMSDSSKYRALKLPVAFDAVMDEPELAGRLVINLREDGKVMILGKEYDAAQLEGILKEEAALTRSNINDANSAADRSVIMRIDQYTDYRHVSRLFEACVKHNLWKLSFYTADPGAPQNMALINLRTPTPAR